MKKDKIMIEKKRARDRAYIKAYREANKDKIAEKGKAYREANKVRANILKEIPAKELLRIVGYFSSDTKSKTTKRGSIC